jgi:transposase
MTLLPRGVKVHLAFGFIDMRKGINGLAMLVQGVLRQDPFSGHLFVFRGRKANLIKIVFWDGTGLCLFTKRLEHGAFLWPSNVEPGGTLMLTSAQLSMLIAATESCFAKKGNLKNEIASFRCLRPRNLAISKPPVPRK